MKRALTIFVCACLFLNPGTPVLAADAPKRPNILFILADDLGWVDTGCYGSTYHKTPNIDALARRGMRFTQAYAAHANCSPTRASILTGLWPARLGITMPSCHLPEERLEEKLETKAPASQKTLQPITATRLKTDYFTLGKALKEAGYRNGHFGKWHLGPEPYDPLHHGFDVDFPHYSGPAPPSYLAPWKLGKGMPDGKPGEHLEDRVADEVIKFITENKDRPFFANYWCFSVHGPIEGKQKLIDEYDRTADPENQHHNPVYAAMVQTLDENVGRVVKAVEDLGLADRTIIVFFSDNGGQHKAAKKTDDVVTSNLPLRAGKGTLYEGGTREPLIVNWPGVTKARVVTDALVQSTDFYPTLLEMIGVPPKPGLKFDGVSFVPALKGGPSQRQTIFSYFPHQISPGVSVRQGDWKLIRRFCGNNDQTDSWELYNLKDDLGEETNLAAAKPEKVKELDRLIDGFLKETKAVVPKANPAYVRGGR